jgi:predicted cation transporter
MSSLSTSSISTSLSPPSSYKEIGLIFLGIIISLVMLGLIVSYFLRKKKQSIPSSSPSPSRTTSNFAQLNIDRQNEELKMKMSSFNTPYL